MKPDHSFAAERALASHCPELLNRANGNRQRAELLRAFSGDLCGALPPRLQPLLIGPRIRAKCSDGEVRTGASLAQSIGPRAANFALRLTDWPTPFYLSIDLGTAFTLTDRLFGGDGKLMASTPDILPHSVLMAMESIALAAASALAMPGPGGGEAVIAGTHENISRLEHFPRGDYFACWTIAFEQEGSPDWTIQIAAREADFLVMLKNGGERRRVAEIPGDAADTPFGEIPLTLMAQLAELQLPLSRLASLMPGDLIPLSPMRSATLRIGQNAFAQGTIGTLDERIALRLTRICLTRI